ncbi:MAG: tail fiber domain-containing protein [Deltaproteobacteria bacterium]|nr:tail fiber domain-containing protein [Deltaproteobacteria bacterium]
MKRILVLTAGILLLCGNLYAGNGDIVASGSVEWGVSRGSLSTDQGASIELGGSGTPFIDFSNDSTSDYDMRITLTGDDKLEIAGGNVGIGIDPTAYQLQLLTNSAGKPATTTWTISSDERLKSNIKTFNDGLSVILGINPVWYRYNGKGGIPDSETGKDYIGIVAQEMQKVAPYTVGKFKAKFNKEDTQDTELLDFNPHALFFVLINAIKEQQAAIEALQSTVTQLQSKSK